jgi:hypothetical protein
MTSTVVDGPTGYTYTPATTLPQFGVFLVLPTGNPTPPAAPTSLSATPGNAQVALFWNASTGATSYNVKRSTTSGGPYTPVKTAQTSTSYTDTALTNGVPYYYVVSAVNNVGEGSNSTQASATPIASDTIPPTVLAASFDWTVSPNQLIVQFSENVATSLSAADVAVQNLSTPGSVPVNGPTYNPATNTATFTFTPAVLPNANFRATLLAAGITDAANNHLDGDGNGVGGDDYLYNFFYLAGDANHDRNVDIVDLGTVGTNWQQSPRTWSQGDFDYSGMVDIVDLGIVGTNWQTYLAPPASAGQSSSPASVVKVKGGATRRKR